MGCLLFVALPFVFLFHSAIAHRKAPNAFGASNIISRRIAGSYAAIVALRERFTLTGRPRRTARRDEVIDALNVALVVGGSITIPHVRRAFARMREIDGLKNS